MDRLVRSLFLWAGFRERLGDLSKDGPAVMALGSYGRRELCLGSDVDLVVIHRERLLPETDAVIKRALYPLWDAKLEVGQSVLTVQEAIRLSSQDFRVLTALLDARFLMGSRVTYRLFESAFWSRLGREKQALIRHFLYHQQKRNDRFGGEEYFVEPELKEGPGGLRDLHTITWMARIYFRCRDLRDLQRFAIFSRFDIDKLNYSRAFLLKLRNLLHHLAGRREDRLLLSYQEELSRRLGYAVTPYPAGPEKLMRQVYLHLNRVRYGHEEFETKALEIMDPSPEISPPLDLPSGLVVRRGNIALGEKADPLREPILVLSGLLEAKDRGLFLDPEFIWRARRAILHGGKGLRASSEARHFFLRLMLGAANPKILRLALEIGLIDLFIPEFKRIRNMAEFGFYHVETVDLHCLRTLDVICEIERGNYDERWPLFRRVLRELPSPNALRLAALLHDIGKGYPGDHSGTGADLVPRILKRLGYSGGILEDLAFLIRNHLVLARIAQGRDLTEERTCVEVAQIIQRKDLLRTLFLLTVADSFATGPIARSEWKIMLLVELYFKVLNILERGTLASPDATLRIEAKRAALVDRLQGAFPTEAVSELCEQVSSRYFLRTDPEDMVEHFRMALTLGEEKLAWRLQRLSDAQVTRIILCTYDRPGLFSKMVGVFTLHDIRVLSANIFTLKNGLAFDIYEVTNPLDPDRDQEKWHAIQEEIRMALEERLPLEERIEEKRQWGLLDGRRVPQGAQVGISNGVSDFFTVIEVKSGEKVGLLYDLAKAIFSLGLDIRFAKVMSDREKMQGAFYVRTSDGQKITEADDIRTVRERLLEVVGQ
jgi:[protein-PII] uridylyltransferase